MHSDRFVQAGQAEALELPPLASQFGYVGTENRSTVQKAGQARATTLIPQRSPVCRRRLFLCNKFQSISNLFQSIRAVRNWN